MSKKNYNIELKIILINQFPYPLVLRPGFLEISRSLYIVSCRIGVRSSLCVTYQYKKVIY